MRRGIGVDSVEFRVSVRLEGERKARERFGAMGTRPSQLIRPLVCRVFLY